ncbi:hypothetical protein DFH07DRAFT_957989 [Mycena maculata]|uniref:Uncharacterized protein n=1 Tax=Mycena maculata TaxID=230809 RepID=A0AAD7J8A4_9AGAR|nr:hypothetical protein DFH07DRAFT_957989 [Mycena maculata]
MHVLTAAQAAAFESAGRVTQCGASVRDERYTVFTASGTESDASSATVCTLFSRHRHCSRNAGFGNDKLLMETEESNSWVYKNKDDGMKSTTALLNLIFALGHSI